jgi:hypothetical protein
MASNTGYDPDADLPPPGSRWGAGAQSVLPYLTRSLRAKPAEPREPRGADAVGPARPQGPQRPDWPEC